MALQPDGEILAAGGSDLFGGFPSGFTLALFQTNGKLDPSFGTNGVAFNSFNSTTNTAARAIALEPNGQIVLAGYVTLARPTEVALARYNANGTPDMSFGTKGFVITALGTYSIATGVAIDASGNIVVAGEADGSFALARYTSKGTLDPSFGTQGTVKTQFGPTEAIASGLVLQPADGKIVVVGHAPGFGGNSRFTVVRYNTNGTLDTSFNHTGEVLDNGASDARAVAIQPDGKIVAVGTATDQSFESEVAVARYNTDGSPDQTFHGTGKNFLKLGVNDAAGAVLVQGNGKIVVAGNSGIPGGSPVLTVRYNANGTLDTSFGTNGTVLTKISGGNDEGHAVVIQADGKIVTGGIACTSCFPQGYGLVRYFGDPALSASGFKLTATAGAPVAATVATFTAADGNLTAGQFSATVSWGDGTTSPGKLSPDPKGGFDIVGSHTFAAAGSYVMSVTINGPLGISTTAAGSATVSDLGQTVARGDAARIGFWARKGGQALISAFNGGGASTALSAWLAGNFGNLFGANAGADNLSGMTNVQVAAFYEMLYDSPGQPKLYAQVLATALNVYATTQSLGGTAGPQFGFTVSATGLGAKSINVGDDGAAFGVANGTTINVFEALLATNKQAGGGILYGGNHLLASEAGAVYDLVDRVGLQQP
jgi:uncharacterized delta-60 repeat protein